jgi:hypothetical protein
MKNKSSIKHIVFTNFDVIGVFSLMLAIFSYIMFGMGLWKSDLPSHGWIAEQMLEKKQLFMGNFLMYFLVNLFTFFTGKRYKIRAILTLLIAIASVAKYIIARESFKEFTTSKIARWISLSLMFVYVIPWLYYLQAFGLSYDPGYMFQGRYFVPNVWHNSTIICMMPFAMLTYMLSVKQFKEYSNRRNRLITLYVALGVLIKPSFFFVYAVAYPLVIFGIYGFKKEFWRSLIPVGIGSLCVLYEYLTIYYNGGEDGSGVVIDVLQLFTLDFWEKQGPYLIVSLAFPIVFLCLYWHRIVKDKEFWFVVLMIVCAIGIWWCCKETGPRCDHANFYWQVIVVMWFTYYYILKVTLNDLKSHTFTLERKGKIVLLLYGLHVLSGLVYLSRYLITENYA